MTPKEISVIEEEEEWEGGEKGGGRGEETGRGG
jgi:hypothetical protein